MDKEWLHQSGCTWYTFLLFTGTVARYNLVSWRKKKQKLNNTHHHSPQNWILYIRFFPHASIFRYVHDNISHEKCSHVNLTQSCKSGRLKLSIGFHEIFIQVDLIYDFGVEFAEKTWRVNNLIYSKRKATLTIIPISWNIL